MSDAETARFYLDEDVPVSAALIARGMGLDVIATGEMGAKGRDDWEQLALAASESRILVTYNRNDYLKLTGQALATGKPHAGILIVVPGVPREGPVIAHALRRWCESRPPLQPYEVQYLSRWSPDGA